MENQNKDGEKQEKARKEEKMRRKREERCYGDLRKLTSEQLSQRDEDEKIFQMTFSLFKQEKEVKSYHI